MNTNAPLSHRFTVLWFLSTLAPALIYVACLYVLAPYMADSLWARIAALLPVPIWLLVGVFQFLLLRSRLRHALVWVVATFVGGVVGHFVGGLSRIHTEPYVEELLLRRELISEPVPAWVSDVYSLAPLLVASVINLAIVAILQSFCFDKAMKGRAVWILASILASIVSLVCGAFLGWNLLQFLMATGLGEIALRWLPVTLMSMSIVPIINFAIYGLITGAVMRWLMNRRTLRQTQTVAGQFD